MTELWRSDVPHCRKERRIVAADGTDGGGHYQCLTELNPDGSCPRESEHHDVYIRSLSE